MMSGPKTTLRGLPTFLFGAIDADVIASGWRGVGGCPGGSGDCISTSCGSVDASEVGSRGGVLGMTGSTGNADDVGVAGLSGA